jgi:hypothetical protein
MRETALSAAKLKESLQELALLGSPVDLAVAVVEVEREKVEIEQVGCIHDSEIFELEDGRVALMADIAVTNQTSRTMYGFDVELRTDWGDSGWDWLMPRLISSQGRAKRDCSYRAYQFPGSCGLQLEYDQVINHFLLERQKLPSKRRLEGWLLGIGGLMPASLRHGQWVDVPLAIVGSDHAEYLTTLRLWTERLDVQPKVAKRRTSLFARPGEEEMDIARTARWTSQNIPRPPLEDRPELEESH